MLVLLPGLAAAVPLNEQELSIDKNTWKSKPSKTHISLLVFLTVRWRSDEQWHNTQATQSKSYVLTHFNTKNILEARRFQAVKG
jgi:hypothetical protein